MQALGVPLQPCSIEQDIFTTLLDGALCRRGWVTLEESLVGARQSLVTVKDAAAWGRAAPVLPPQPGRDRCRRSLFHSRSALQAHSTWLPNRLGPGAASTPLLQGPRDSAHCGCLKDWLAGDNYTKMFALLQ